MMGNCQWCLRQRQPHYERIGTEHQDERSRLIQQRPLSIDYSPPAAKQYESTKAESTKTESTKTESTKTKSPPKVVTGSGYTVNQSSIIRKPGQVIGQFNRNLEPSVHEALCTEDIATIPALQESTDNKYISDFDNESILVESETFPNQEMQSGLPSILVSGSFASELSRTQRYRMNQRKSEYVFSSNIQVDHEAASDPCGLPDQEILQDTSRESFSDRLVHFHERAKQVESVKSDPTFLHIGAVVSDSCSHSSSLTDEEDISKELLSDANSLQQQNKVPFFLSHTLPVVKKYFPFAETLALSFLQPMEVVTLTSKGIVIINEREGISVHVADDTVPIGRILHLELGSAMHGRLSFPKNFSPVSPILWICPQEDIPLQKPIKITLPHTVKYEDGTSELVFMKAHHKTPLIMPTSSEYKFEFEEMVNHEGVEFNERNGLISTRQFCPVCIAEKISKPSTKRYLLLRTQPKKTNTSRFSVDYCVIYTLPTCLATFCNYCTKRDLELRCDWPEFTFASDKMGLLEPQSTSGWMVEVQSKKNTIAESEVDFWQYDVELLKLYQEIRRYPPKITLNLHGGRATDACTFSVFFSGIIASPPSPPLQDVITISSEEYITGWTQHSPNTGKKTREYITLLKNLSSLVKELRTCTLNLPLSKDQLCLKFMENEWISPAENPSEKELVLQVLNRVEKDSQAFHKFVSLLSEIGGLKEVAKDLMKKLKSADFN